MTVKIYKESPTKGLKIIFNIDHWRGMQYAFTSGKAYDVISNPRGWFIVDDFGKLRRIIYWTGTLLRS